MPQNNSYTVVTCHFGDRFWVGNLARRLADFHDPRIGQIVVVDQSRDSMDFLLGLPGVTAVLEFPADEAQIALGGHDHPASLNRALAEYAFTTSHVVIFDSDAFPLAPDWVDLLEDVTLAEVPGSDGELSHPCFMCFPVAAIPFIDFSEGFLQRVDHSSRFRFDTGRMVAKQLRQRGYEVTVSRSKPGFSGFRGDLYLEGRVHHHGHASHTSAPLDLRRSMSQKTEDLWKRKIQKTQMSLTPLDYVLLGFFYLQRRAANKISDLLARNQKLS